jgi:integrase
LKASRQRYQQGSLLKQRRANGNTDWVLRYRVTLPDGHRAQRQVVVGTTKEYPTESQARKAADHARLTINDKALSAQPTVETVASHFKEIELHEHNLRRAWSTKQKHKDLLNCYILPRWGTNRMMDVKAVAVEAWLGTLMVTKGGKKNPHQQTMADPTKQSIRNTFATLFTHAQRYEFVPPNHNPIKLVRQSGQRSHIPDILTPSEINALWHGSGKREQAMISIEYGNGLRISEAIGLKWHDIDFAKGTAMVNKSVVKGHVGETKTEASKRLVPLHAGQLEDLNAWREVAPYPDNDSWVFASHLTKGLKPY